MKDHLALIIIGILSVLSLILISLTSYLIIFESMDKEELILLRVENSGTKAELSKYLRLVQSSKSDCDAKIAGAKKIWEANKDVKNNIDNSDGGMVTFEFGGLRN